MDKQIRVIPTKEDIEYMDKPRKVSPFILDSDGQWKLRHEPKVTKPIIDIYLPESERIKTRELVDYSPFIKGQITEDERKKWVKRYIDKLLIESANHAAKQIIDFTKKHNLYGDRTDEYGLALTVSDWQELLNLVKEK